MANIQTRYSKKGEITFRVQIRMKGHPPIFATFQSKDDALEFAMISEDKIRKSRKDSGIIFQYQDAPAANVFDVLNNKDKVPNEQGIYFLWGRHNIEYVGMAKKIRDRVCTKKHQKLSSHHSLSFIVFPGINKQHLAFIEAAYIGRYKPVLNEVSIKVC